MLFVHRTNTCICLNAGNTPKNRQKRPTLDRFNFFFCYLRTGKRATVMPSTCYCCALFVFFPLGKSYDIYYCIYLDLINFAELYWILQIRRKKVSEGKVLVQISMYQSVYLVGALPKGNKFLYKNLLQQGSSERLMGTTARRAPRLIQSCRQSEKLAIVHLLVSKKSAQNGYIYQKQ